MFSDLISEEVDVIPSLMHRESLSKQACEWAASALAARELPKPSPAEALSRIEQSSFNISHSMERLYALYGA